MGSELIGSNVDGNFDGEGDGKGKNDLAHISINASKDTTSNNSKKIGTQISDNSLLSTNSNSSKSWL